MKQTGLVVLVIEDNREYRKFIQHVLERARFQVITADSAIDGFALMLQYQPDVVCVDLVMPGMTGWEFVEMTQRHPDTKDIPVLVVSASSPNLRSEFDHVQFDAFLQKPFAPQVLVATLLDLLGVAS